MERVHHVSKNFIARQAHNKIFNLTRNTHHLFYVIYFYSIGDGLKTGRQEYLPTSQKYNLRGTQFMSSRGYTAIHQLFVAVRNRPVDVSPSLGLRSSSEVEGTLSKMQ